MKERIFENFLYMRSDEGENRCTVIHCSRAPHLAHAVEKCRIPDPSTFILSSTNSTYIFEYSTFPIDKKIVNQLN